MPIYEYQCRECGHRLETMQRLSDPPLTECPECRGELKKLISAPSFQFKGSGWYVTDYAGKKGDSKGEGEDKGKAAGESKSEGGSGDGAGKSDGAAKSEGKAEKASKEPAKKTATS